MIINNLDQLLISLLQLIEVNFGKYQLQMSLFFFILIADDVFKFLTALTCLFFFTFSFQVLIMPLNWILQRITDITSKAYPLQTLQKYLVCMKMLTFLTRYVSLIPPHLNPAVCHSIFLTIIPYTFSISSYDGYRKVLNPTKKPFQSKKKKKIDFWSFEENLGNGLG